MGDIFNLDLKSYIIDSVVGVFDMMLSMDIDVVNSDSEIDIEGKKIAGSVALAGNVTGIVGIQMKYDFARQITASMLGMELDEIESNEDVNDVIGELGNMIAGNLKSIFCDAGFPCELSIPSVTHGNSFIICPLKGTKKERIYFRNADDKALVELCLKM